MFIVLFWFYFEKEVALRWLRLRTVAIWDAHWNSEVKIEGENESSFSCRESSPFPWIVRPAGHCQSAQWIYQQETRAGLALSPGGLLGSFWAVRNSVLLCMLCLTHTCHRWRPSALDSAQLEAIWADNTSAAKLCISF